MSPLLSKVIFNRSLIKSRQNWWGLFDTWLDLNATMTISEATLKQIKKIQQAKHIPLYNSFPMWFWCHFFFYWILISILPYFPFPADSQKYHPHKPGTGFSCKCCKPQTFYSRAYIGTLDATALSIRHPKNQQVKPKNNICVTVQALHIENHQTLHKHCTF